MEGKFILKSINIYYCGHEQCPPGHSFGPAIRPHYLIHFILNGKGCYEARGKKHYLKQGDAFLICPGESTFYKADEQTPWEYAWVAAGGTELETLLEMSGMDRHNLICKGRPNDDACERNKRILTLVDLFLANHNNEPELLSSFYGVFARLATKENKEQLTPASFYCKEACTYIHNNYSYPIKINEIANYIGIDRTYLYKIFMKEKKISPQDYLIQYRLQIATNMLHDKNLTITEIAYSCGFKDVQSFSRQFKRDKGTSPRQYKQVMIPYS